MLQGLKRFGVMLTFGAGLFAGGCDSGSTNTADQGTNADMAMAPANDLAMAPGDMAMAATAKVRVIHAAAKVPSTMGGVDIYLGGAKAVTNLKFGEATPYVPVPVNTALSGDVRPTGATAAGFAISLPALTANAKVTIVATGDATKAAGNADAFKVLPLVENFTAPNPGEVNVRLVHASPDSPTVRVGLDPNAPPTMGDLPRYADATIKLPLSAAGAPAGIYTAATPPVKLTQFTLNAAALTGLAAKSVNFFVIAAGTQDKLPREGEGFQLLVTTDDPTVTAQGPLPALRQDPVVYALHAGVGAPAVDVYARVGTTALKLAGGPTATYATISAPIQVSPGTYSLEVFGNGSTPTAGSAVVSGSTPALEPGERYLAMVTGELNVGTSTNTLALSFLKDEFTLNNSTKAFVRLVHGSSLAPSPVAVGTTIDMSTKALGGIVAQNLVYKAATAGGGLELASGAEVTLGLASVAAPSMVTNPIAIAKVTIPSDVLSGGLRAFAIVGGSTSLRPENAQGLKVIGVITSGAAPWSVATLDFEAP
jgi:hypothetical protein